MVGLYNGCFTILCILFCVVSCSINPFPADMLSVDIRCASSFPVYHIHVQAPCRSLFRLVLINKTSPFLSSLLPHWKSLQNCVCKPIWRSFLLWPTFASTTIKASVTKDSKRTFLTFSSVMRDVQFLRRDWKTVLILKFKMDTPALESHTRMSRLRVLNLLTPDSVFRAIFYENRSCLHKTESDIPWYAFFSQRFYPFKIARSRPTIVFSTTGNLLYQPTVEIFSYTDRP